MNTQKGNKLIAEFMGAPKCDTSTPQYDFTEMDGINVPHGWKYETNLRFHCDWNWLIPVVEKIQEEFETDDTWGCLIRINTNSTSIIIPDGNGLTFDHYDGSSRPFQIENVWKCCVIAIQEWCVQKRIACYEAGYPYCEARYGSIEEYRKDKETYKPLDYTPTIEESPFLYKRKEIHV